MNHATRQSQQFIQALPIIINDKNNNNNNKNDDDERQVIYESNQFVN